MALLLLATPALSEEPQGHRDLAYAEPKNERRTLDVYAPKEGRNHPIVFWIHGGGWQRGDKTEVQVKPQAFVDRDFVIISTNYRFVPSVSIKEMAGDITKSIRWVHDHAQEYGGDPSTIFVMGHFAGAQLAALVCTDDRHLRVEKLSLSIIKGCVPVDGDTYDVPMQIATVEQKRKDAYRFKFGDEGSQKDLSPVMHVAKDKSIPPFLILHVADHPETTAQSERLANALQQAGISAKAHPAKGKDHGTINEVEPPEKAASSVRPNREPVIMQKRLIRVSKYLSKYLRHAPQELGLTLQPGGWVAVDELLVAADKNGFPISYDELVDCVETNDKQRFAFDETGDRIRANQGHSVEVDLQLEEREPPEFLYHGTVELFLPSILKEGLIRGKRHHVHLSKDVETARKVGSRRGKPVVLQVDARRMHRDGHKFLLSANGVWLTDTVPPGYLKKT